MKIKLSFFKLEYIIGISISVLSFIVYVDTLCPTVNFIDSGELAAVAYTMGIAHPTGYPLFTLIGYLFSHLPIDIRPIVKLNLMSAFLCAFALFFFFRFLLNFLTLIGDHNYSYLRKQSLSFQTILIYFLPSAFGTLILGFSETYWKLSLSIEVHSLHILFISLILFLFSRAIETDNKSSSDEALSRQKAIWWLLLAYILGLSFTNHLTTIVLLPALLYGTFVFFGLNEKVLWRIIYGSVPFLVGLSVYLFLPIQSNNQPMLNWGNPVDFEKILWHISGKVYRVWFLSSTESAIKQSQYFFSTLPERFGYLPLLFSIAGVILLFKRNKKILYLTLFLFFGCLLYAINYDIHDIDSYFLLAYYAIALLAAIGVSLILLILKRVIYFQGIAILLLLLILMLVNFNYSKVDESDNYVVEKYSEDLFKSIEENGLIISYQWDYFISAAYYFQIVEGKRRDVIIIDKELLRRSWYFNQLETWYPWLTIKIKNELDLFLKELYKFEHDLPYNPALIERLYTEVILGIIRTNYDERAIYVTPEIEPQYTIGYERIPSGLTFKLIKDKEYIDIPFPKFSVIDTKRTDKYVKGVKSIYTQSYVNKALYLHRNNQNQKALKYLNEAKRISPYNREIEILRENILRNY